MSILSYAIPKGKTFEENLKNLEDPNLKYTQEVFEEGITVKAPFPFPEILPDHLQGKDQNRMVVNTYYSRDGFRKLVDKCGLKISQSILVGEHSDNFREVVALTKKI